MRRVSQQRTTSPGYQTLQTVQWALVNAFRAAQIWVCIGDIAPQPVINFCTRSAVVEDLYLRISRAR